MSIEEFKFSEQTVLIEKKEELPSFFRIRSYKQKLKSMEERKIPQKDINDVVNHFFLEYKKVPEKVKKSISKIIYCIKDRILIAITESGKEIIWKREDLVKSYGWFFFVSETDDISKSKEDGKSKGKRKRKDKDPPKEEKTLSIIQYKFEEKSIPIKQKENMRSLYNTKECHQFLNMIKNRKIPQMPINDFLNDFFNEDKLVPVKEKKAIGKIIYYNKERVIVIKSLIGDQMYENLKRLVSKYGWYFYITGVPVGSSKISIAIDNIEKKFSSDYFKSISLTEDLNSQEIKVSLYPVSLKPNHNCHILKIGKLSILLDCGIFEEDFQNIDTYYELIQKKSGDKQEKPDDSEDSKLLNNEVENSKPKIDVIFLSHSHYDHVNGLKRITSLYPDIPILCSRITLDLYLLRDSKFLKQENHEKIEEEEYRNIIKNVIYVENGTKLEFKNQKCYLSFYHAGHMPGALMILAKIKKYRFLYTGDYTYWDFTPFAGTRKFLEQISRPIDFLLIDSTSAYEEFDDITQQINNLILFLEQKTEYGDNSLIGADPSSLAITFMLTIWRYFRKKQLRRNYKKRPNIYVDMMVRRNIQVINHRYEYIYGPISKLIRDKANPFNSIKFRWFDYSDLEFLRKRNNIIISHPPDLSYGIIRNVVNVVGRNPHNLVYLAGALHEEPAVSLVYPPENEIIEEKEVIENEDVIEEKEVVKSLDVPSNDDIKEESNINQDTEIINGIQEADEEESQIKFEPKVVRKEGSKNPEIIFTETWKFPFRSMLLNQIAPNLKLKLHGDKKQLFEMIKVLEPKEICFFHQNPRRLNDVAKEIKESGIEKVSISQEKKLIELN